MRTAASPATALRSEPAETLLCPECRQPNTVALSDLFEGAEIECHHCPADLVVEREWQEDGDTHARWVLVEPYEDDVDEGR